MGALGLTRSRLVPAGRDHVESNISGEEGRKEERPECCEDPDRVVEKLDCSPFLDRDDAVKRDLEFLLTGQAGFEEQVICVESECASDVDDLRQSAAEPRVMMLLYRNGQGLVTNIIHLFQFVLSNAAYWEA